MLVKWFAWFRFYLLNGLDGKDCVSYELEIHPAQGRIGALFRAEAVLPHAVQDDRDRKGGEQQSLLLAPAQSGPA